MQSRRESTNLAKVTTVNNDHLLPRTAFSCTDSQVYTESALRIATKTTFFASGVVFLERFYCKRQLQNSYTCEQAFLPTSTTPCAVDVPASLSAIHSYCPLSLLRAEKMSRRAPMVRARLDSRRPSVRYQVTFLIWVKCRLDWQMKATDSPGWMTVIWGTTSTLNSVKRKWKSLLRLLFLFLFLLMLLLSLLSLLLLSLFVVVVVVAVAVVVVVVAVVVVVVVVVVVCCSSSSSSFIVDFGEENCASAYRTFFLFYMYFLAFIAVLCSHKATNDQADENNQWSFIMFMSAQRTSTRTTEQSRSAKQRGVA